MALFARVIYKRVIYKHIDTHNVHQVDFSNIFQNVLRSAVGMHYVQRIEAEKKVLRKRFWEIMENVNIVPSTPYYYNPYKLK